MATSIDLFRSSVEAWDDLCIRASGGVVFIDNALAESLHWHGGALQLLNTGAIDVKEFSPFENGTKGQKKGVFVVSGPLMGTSMDIIKDIIDASHFHHVTVASSLSPSMHTIMEYGAGENDENKAFSLYKQLIAEWLHQDAVIEFCYLPLVMAPLTQNIFVLPQHHDNFPLLPHTCAQLLVTNRDHSKTPEKPGDIQYTDLPKHLQLQFKLLVCSLNSLLECLSVSEEIFHIGHTSRILAHELASLSWAKSRRKSVQQRASLLLVDRTLDITSAVGHHSDTMLDKIMASLTHLPGHTNDICVDMSPICHTLSNPDFSVIAPGCLAHAEDGAAKALLNTYAQAKHKECLMEINRQIVEAANRDKLPLKLSGRPGKVSVEQLEAHVALFKMKSAAITRNCGQLQLVLAAIQAMKHKQVSKSDSLLGVEKGLIQVLGEGESFGPSLLSQLTHTVQKEAKSPVDERLFSLEDIFLLLLFVYSLAGRDCCNDIEEENFLQNILAAVIQEEGKENLPNFLKELVADDFSDDRITGVLESIFDKLNSVSTTRDNLQQYCSLISDGSITTQATLQPLLKQLTEDIFSPNRPDLPDIGYVSTGLGNLLKSGFGLWRSASKPRPNDHPLLVIFVTGGVTAAEVRCIKEAVTASKSDVQVVIGSTRLITPTDLLDNIFAQNPLQES